MPRRLDELLKVDQVAGSDVFYASGLRTSWGRLFGGQILGQAVVRFFSSTFDDVVNINARHRLLWKRQSRMSFQFIVFMLTFSWREIVVRRFSTRQKEFTTEDRSAEEELPVNKTTELFLSLQQVSKQQRVNPSQSIKYRVRICLRFCHISMFPEVVRQTLCRNHLSYQ